MSLRMLGRDSVVRIRGAEVDAVDEAGVGTAFDAVDCLSLLISERKDEKAADDKSIRVKSVKRVFSAIKASF